MIESTRSFLLVDDHPVVRMAAKIIIERTDGWHAPYEASCPSDAIRLIQSLDRPPNVVILDLLYDGECGIELLEHITSNYRWTRSLVYSVRVDAHYAQRCLRSGASAYICKEDPPDILSEAIRVALRGRTFVSPTIARNIADRFSTSCNGQTLPGVEGLSGRELEVFQLIGHGMTTRQIADRLHRSVKTIETYRYRIKQKLGTRSTVELAQMAGRHVEGLADLRTGAEEH